MKKKSRKVSRSLESIQGISLEERDLFLKAFFTGEIEKEEKVEKLEKEKFVSIDKHIEINQETHEELSEKERALFLQAAQEIVIGQRFSREPNKTPIIPSKKHKIADGVIDLHGMIAEDAVRALLEFLKREKIRGSKTLLVVHGKGAGILRNAVWAVLESHSAVNDFYIAPPRFGGQGALIVRINRRVRW